MTDHRPFEFDASVAAHAVADRLGLPEKKVAGAVALLVEKNTIPFIARYRKEHTGGLDETRLAAIDDALTLHRELLDRKNTISKTLAELGLLDDAKLATIRNFDDRKALEDFYLPFKPKRRTRATEARERGLEPLAAFLLEQVNPRERANEFLERFANPAKGVPDGEAALRGACDILAEQWAVEPTVRRRVREAVSHGTVTSRKRRGYDGEDDRFESYYDHREPIRRLASHRFLAMKRGEQEGALSIGIEVDVPRVVRDLQEQLAGNKRFVFARTLANTVEDCFDRLLFPSIRTEALSELKERADEEAIDVFATNLSELLLAAPAGPRIVLGIDPGFRTGCKVAVIDRTGRFVEHTTIYPTPPRRDTAGAGQVLRDLITRHGVEIVAIGNGTASRETDAFVAEVFQRSGDAALQDVRKVTVSEAGASIYSASEVARDEFPDLDLTIRGAISIARRLQDPLAELVKIDPKSIGVGQYQHDVKQARLAKTLDRVVARCVNNVGVDLNTSSAPLLAHVSGIGPRLAQAIVAWRDDNGAFRNRKQLEEVARFGARAFEQSAGFLRIRDGEHVLDDSAVHPESYYVVERMAKTKDIDVRRLIGNTDALATLDPVDFIDEQVGVPTVTDIIDELAKPGRDPRNEFRIAQFAEGVDAVDDLEPGMKLEGVVTNVTHFGAFVDVGVHQDGLIHVSELDRRFVRDPSAVVKVGDIIDVVVLEVDAERKRIALSRKAAL